MSGFDKHMNAYLQEAEELLGNLEAYLLELEASPKDKDIIAKVFRVIHTIKGTSSMFGFEDIEKLTHEAETYFDLIRTGKKKVTKKLIDQLLECKDVVRAIIDAHLKDESFDNNIVKECAGKFSKLVQQPGGETPPPVSPSGFTINMDDDLASSSEVKEYRVRFTPSPNVFLRGIDPMKLVDELHALGQCTVYIDTENLPSIDDLDSDKCYTSWDIALSSTCHIDEIKNIFSFIEEDSEISITTVGDELCNPFVLDAEGDENIAPGPRKKLDKVLSVRVEADKLDTMVDLVGEMVTIQAGLNQTASDWEDLDIYSDNEKLIFVQAGQIADLVSMAEKMDSLVDELRDNTMDLRMFPIGTIFEKFRRLVRDLSGELGKDIELVTEGGDTKLDKTVIERLSDPLVHLIRNCIDHGIETPEERRIAGKTDIGRIILSAEHSGGNVSIRIKDNGSGIDLNKIKEKAVDTGRLGKDEELVDEDILALITEPGFSTAAEVTNVSGRGVGMDVVKRNIESLRGTLDLVSTKGEGTTITLSLPLTLAIIDGLLVKVGADNYIIPLSEVIESVELTEQDIEETNGRDLARVRDELVPYINLRDIFDVRGDVPEIQHIVITGQEDYRVGFVVDSIIGGHQTVIKSLGSFYKQIKCVSGATILGDGTVALILDVKHIILKITEKEKESFA